MNNILFSLIGILMLAITGLGVAELKIQGHQEALTQAGVTASTTDVTTQTASETPITAAAQVIEKTKAAVTGSWEEGDERDYDDDEDDGQRASVQTSVAQSAPAKTTQPSPATTGASAGTYTMAQIATHNSRSSCYTTIDGSVYDVTSFISQHPGGASAILSLCGHDGSAAFNGQHGGQRRPASELAGFKIGVLAQ